MFTSKACSPDITRVWYHVESQFHHVPVLAASVTHYVQSSRHVGMTIVIEQYVLEPKHSWRSIIIGKNNNIYSYECLLNIPFFFYKFQKLQQLLHPTLPDHYLPSVEIIASILLDFQMPSNLQIQNMGQQSLGLLLMRYKCPCVQGKEKSN